MSEAIATIPNYCSYETFKTGFDEGLGIGYNEDGLSCGKSNPQKIRARYYGIERTVDCTCLLMGQARDSGSHMRSRNRNSGKSSIGGRSRCTLGKCDWFDAYSVSYRYSNVVNGGTDCECRTRKTGTNLMPHGMTFHQVHDHHQEIEDVLSERLRSSRLSNSDSGLSSSRNSTAKSWKRSIDHEGFRYSKEKGCIDWLETKCHNQGLLGIHGLRKTNSDKELIKSFEDQFVKKKIAGKVKNGAGLRLNYFLISKPGMLPACPHLTRKFGTNNSSCEDVRALNSVESGEGTLEEEVFDDNLYYLGIPKVSSRQY